MEEKLMKSYEDIESLRKFKNDTLRRDELVKDYK
jgi:hypothetical protein